MTKQLKSPATKALVVETAATPVAVVEPTPIEVPKAELAVIPTIHFKDLKVSREGHFQVQPKVYKALVGQYGKDAVRAAVQAVVALKGADISLETGLLLATWPGFRPFMLQQLAAAWSYKDREGAFNVLSWIWTHEGWTFAELYTEFPRVGRPGLKVGKDRIGKANALLAILDGLRTDGKKTSPKGLDYLAEGCHLLGWINQ